MFRGGCSVVAKVYYACIIHTYIHLHIRFIISDLQYNIKIGRKRAVGSLLWCIMCACISACVYIVKNRGVLGVIESNS